MRSWSIIAIAGMLSLAALPTSAQQSSSTANQPTQHVELTNTQRSQIAEQIISRWMGHVLKSPGGDVKAWSSKLRNVIATADQTNVLTASQMPSLDLAHAALAGAAIDDAAVRAALSATSTDAPQALGSATSDTTYTPLPNGRCRVASSLAITSPLPTGVARNIRIEATASYASQGGVGSIVGDGSTNCGIPNLVTAYAVSVSARNPAADGALKVFANNRPNAAGNTIPFYVSAKGGAADLIVESCQTCASELAILSTAPTSYIIDVIGYFMPPQATALQCNDTSAFLSIPAGQTQTAFTAFCAAGYTDIGTECEVSQGLLLSRILGGSCEAKNTTGASGSVFVIRNCCRVPGR